MIDKIETLFHFYFQFKYVSLKRKDGNKWKLSFFLDIYIYVQLSYIIKKDEFHLIYLT